MSVFVFRSVTTQTANELIFSLEEKFFWGTHSESPRHPQWVINGFSFHINWEEKVTGRKVRHREVKEEKGLCTLNI